MSHAKQQRVEHANQLIQVIAAHGRKFFYSKTAGRVARIEIDARGRVWFVDDYSERRIYTHTPHRWRGFTHGGTLRSLVEDMRDYIIRGERIRRWKIAPAYSHSDGDIWGYGSEAAAAVRAAAYALPIMEPDTKEQK